MATPITLSLPEHLQEFVTSESATQGCASAAEYVHKLIEEARQQKLRDQVEALLEEGLQSGEPIEVTEAYWVEKQRRLESRLPQAKQP